MAAAPRELSQLQQWMQAVIMHPEGVTAGIDSDAAKQQIIVASENVEQVIARSRALTSVERLEIYASAYYARLLECLREEFPAVVHAVGEETFNAFAIGYLQVYPSRSYTLANLGRDFPRYLAETRPVDEPETESPSWPDFLIDLATLERTYSEVFDAPGVENQLLLQASDLAAISPEEWPQCRLIPVECLRFLTLRFPVHEYATAVRQKVATDDLIGPQPTWLVITRRDYVVRRRAVSQTEYDLLVAIASGERIGDAIAQIANNTNLDMETLAVHLRDWFQTWSSAGYFHRVER